jgi:hypothetical protein
VARYCRCDTYWGRQLRERAGLARLTGSPTCELPRTAGFGAVCVRTSSSDIRVCRNVCRMGESETWGDAFVSNHGGICCAARPLCGSSCHQPHVYLTFAKPAAKEMMRSRAVKTRATTHAQHVAKGLPPALLFHPIASRRVQRGSETSILLLFLFCPTRCILARILGVAGTTRFRSPAGPSERGIT